MPQRFARVRFAELDFYLEQIREKARKDLAIIDPIHSNEARIAQSHLLGQSSIVDAVLLFIRTGQTRELLQVGASKPYRKEKRTTTTAKRPRKKTA